MQTHKIKQIKQKLLNQISRIPKWKVILFFFSFITLGFLVSLFVYAENKLSNLVLGGLGEQFSTRVYSSPYFIKNESTHDLGIIRQRLLRLNYQQVDQSFLKPGQFQISGTGISIYLRGFQTPTYIQNAIRANVSIDKNSVWNLKDVEGIEIFEIGLEPEIVAELSGQTKIRRDPAQWTEFPPHLIQAVVSVEDDKFFKHWGVRPLAILRALIHNIRSDGSTQGGSTITQQLAKNLFLTPQRTLKRKFLEAFLAFYLELRYSKERILTLYLNHIYMGQDGFISIAGMKSAAKYYFGKDIKKLALEECAMLAAMIRSPYLYNPHQNAERAKKRRDFVLDRMLEEEKISADELFEAQSLPLAPARSFTGKKDDKGFSYFIAEVLRELTPVYGEEALYRFGLKIHTTMDPWLQSIAQKSATKTKFQSAVVAIEPGSGRVLALVGGKNYQESQFNRATQAARQPGSAFKPFVFGAALEMNFSPSTFIRDELRGYEGKDNEIWSPKNFDDVYRGSVTVRQALANSMNAATLDLSEKITPQKIIEFARKLGIENPLEESLALALGSYEVSLLEITNAYAPFANGGFKTRPFLISSIVSAEDEVIELQTTEKSSAIDPALAYLMTDLLQTVVKEGTAKRLKNLGWDRPAAGKTGTTNGGKDAWFVGYDPNLLVGVWVGDDQAKAIQAAGSKNALPIWASIMKKTVGAKPVVDFKKPDGLVVVKIDPLTGGKAQSGCKETILETYIKGSEPKEKCSLHAGGIKGWFNKLFNLKPDESQ